MRVVELGEVARIETGTTPSTKNPDYHGGSIPFIKPGDLDEQPKIILESESYVTHLGAKQGRIIPENGVMVCCIGSLGKLAVAGRNMITNQQINSVIFDEGKVYPKFGAYFLSTQKKELEHLASSTTVAIVNKTNFSKLKIPLPSLSEQKVIVAKLDRAQRLIDIDREMLAKYDELIQSVFLEMFGDPVRNEKGWDKIKLKELTKINSGSTPSRKKPEYFGGEIPWVKTTEVSGRFIYESEETITELGLKESSCKLYPKDTILVAMYGQGKTRGNVGMLRLEATSNQACAAIYPSKAFIPDFLFNYLKLQYNELREMGRGGNQPNLNVGMIKDYEIVLPPIDMQNKFLNISESIMKEKAVNRLISKKSEELFSSLVQGFFGS